jgi:hypothetical protein
MFGFALALIMFRLLKLAVHDKRLYQPRMATSRWSRSIAALSAASVSGRRLTS